MLQHILLESIPPNINKIQILGLVRSHRDFKRLLFNHLANDALTVEYDSSSTSNALNSRFKQSFPQIKSTPVTPSTTIVLPGLLLNEQEIQTLFTHYLGFVSFTKRGYSYLIKFASVKNALHAVEDLNEKTDLNPRFYQEPNEKQNSANRASSPKTDNKVPDYSSSDSSPTRKREIQRYQPPQNRVSNRRNSNLSINSRSPSRSDYHNGTPSSSYYKNKQDKDRPASKSPVSPLSPETLNKFWADTTQKMNWADHDDTSASIKPIKKPKNNNTSNSPKQAPYKPTTSSPVAPVKTTGPTNILKIECWAPAHEIAKIVGASELEGFVGKVIVSNHDHRIKYFIFDSVRSANLALKTNRMYMQGGKMVLDPPREIEHELRS